MTRKKVQLPVVNPGDYHRWRRDFESGPFVRQLLAKLPKSEVEYVSSILFATHIGPRSLTREQVRSVWPMLRKRINLIDFAIGVLEGLLEDRTRTINEDIAALLTAACVPAGKSGGWEPEAVKKRRARAKAQTRPWLEKWGPPLLISYLAATLLRARTRS